MLRPMLPVLLAGMLLAGPSPAQELPPPPATVEVLEPANVTAKPIGHFRIGSEEARFGGLEFVGGLELSADHEEFGSISGFRYRDREGRFVAVSDRGYWLFGQILRDEHGRPAAVSNAFVQLMHDPLGVDGHKKRFDAESIALRDNMAIVGFEQEHRVAAFDISTLPVAGAVEQFDILIPAERLKNNASFEAVAVAPQESHLAGALLAITERSTDDDGNILAAILEGSEQGLFTIIRSDNFDITDSVFLPDGDLLLLERSVGISTGIRMRIRRIPLKEIHPYALLSGDVLLEADLRNEIDNMEAIDAWVHEDGSTRIAILSDDNHLRLQRTVYLEFRLLEDTSDADASGQDDSAGQDSAASPGQAEEDEGESLPGVVGEGDSADGADPAAAPQEADSTGRSSENSIP